MHAASHAAPADRRWIALLRARARQLLRDLPPPDRAALRLLPPLLHASFRHPGLGQVAPGIVGLGAGRRWGEIARAFGLPSPHAAQHARRIVRALWLLPGGEIRVVPVDDLAPAEERLIERRLDFARRLLGDRSLRLHVGAADPRVLLHGGLLAGVADAPAAEPIAPAAHAEGAATPLARLLLALVRRADPLPAFLRWSAALPAAWLADPELFAALWARWDDCAGTLPLEAVAAAGRTKAARARAAALAPATRSLRALGRQLVLEVARARWRIPPALREELRGDMLATGIPAALLPALRAAWRTAGEAALAIDGRPGARALVREVALRARLGLPPGGDAFWRQVARRLEAPGGAAAIASIRTRPVDGPPFDPLNRGAHARLCLGAGELLRLRTGRVGAPRLLPGPRLLEELVRAAAAGAPCDLVASDPADAPLVERIDRLLRRCSAAARARKPFAFEAGGDVLLLERGRLRRHTRARFLSRPRRFDVDGEAPVLGAFAGVSVGAAIECRVVAEGAFAWLLWSHGGLAFGEHLPVEEIADWIREAHALVEPEAALLLRQAGAPLPPRAMASRETAVQIALGGDLRDGVWIEVLGERFGASAPWRWTTAASAIAASWPVGTRAPLSFVRVAVRVGGRRASPLEILYARSVARRRLQAHIRAVLSRAAATPALNSDRERAEERGGGRHPPHPRRPKP